MRNKTALALVRIFALTMIVMGGIFLAPKLFTNKGETVIFATVVAGAAVTNPKKALYTLDKSSLPSFIGDIAKAAGDPFYTEFINITKDAAAVIEQLRFDAGLSEKDVADALGCAPNDYLSFVKSGKGLDITPDSITALAKKLKKSVAELAALMVSGGDEPAAGEPNPQTQNQAGAASTMNAGTPPVNPNDPQAKAATNTAKSGQILSIREPSVGGISVSKSGELVGVAKDRTGNIIKSSKSGMPLTIDVLKMQLAGIRSDVHVQKDGIAPGDLLQGGTFVPTEAKGLIELMIADSDILTQVQTFQIPTKKMQVQSHDASNLRLERLATGWSENRQKGTASFMNFDLQRVDIEFEVLDETVELFSNNISGLENFIYNMYRQAFMNRVAYLGWNGVSDSADNAEVTADNAEITLGTGWLTLAVAQCVNAMKLTSAGYATKYDQFKALIAAQLATQPAWNSNDQVIYCSQVDFDAYLTELEQRLDGTMFLGMSAESLKALTFRGKKFSQQNWIPSGSYLMSKPSNLGFATLAGDQGGLKVGRYSQPGSTIYRITMWIDFSLINAAKQIVLSV